MFAWAKQKFSASPLKVQTKRLPETPSKSPCKQRVVDSKIGVGISNLPKRKDTALELTSVDCSAVTTISMEQI